MFRLSILKFRQIPTRSVTAYTCGRMAHGSPAEGVRTEAMQRDSIGLQMPTWKSTDGALHGCILRVTGSSGGRFIAMPVSTKTSTSGTFSGDLLPPLENGDCLSRALVELVPSGGVDHLAL
jgi:hypothetical protein